MTDLDRLLELHDELQEETGYFPHRFYEKTEKEYESLKAKIEGMIEDGKFVKSWVKEYGQGNKDYLKQMYYDLESQVAKLKEDIENGTSHLERLISTLDDIKAYIKLYESRNTNYIYCKNELKAILAKHEGKK
jgi:hypothetical protein